MDRVAIFIDGSNFYHALKASFGKAQIRFDALASALTDYSPDRKLLRVYYYSAAYNQTANPDEYAKQQTFFNKLRRTPYLSLTLGRLEPRSIEIDLDSGQRDAIEKIVGGPLPTVTHVEKGVDVQLAVDMVRLAVADTYDVAILISADGDFAPAVEAVKQLGKHVELGRVKGASCNRLLDVCDIEISIDEKMLAKSWIPRPKK